MILTKGQFSFSELGSKMAFFVVIFQRLIIYFNKGDHGFDNDLEDMKTIFRAFGPNFKKNHLAEPFDSIHIYPLMCKLLGVTPEPHNGSLAVTQEMLVDQRPGEMQKQPPENWQLLPVLRKNRFIMGSPVVGVKSSRIILFPSSFSTPVQDISSSKKIAEEVGTPRCAGDILHSASGAKGRLSIEEVRG